MSTPSAQPDAARASAPNKTTQVAQGQASGAKVAATQRHAAPRPAGKRAPVASRTAQTPPTQPQPPPLPLQLPLRHQVSRGKNNNNNNNTKTTSSSNQVHDQENEDAAAAAANNGQLNEGLAASRPAPLDRRPPVTSIEHLTTAAMGQRHPARPSAPTGVSSGGGGSVHSTAAAAATAATSAARRRKQQQAGRLTSMQQQQPPPPPPIVRQQQQACNSGANSHHNSGANDNNGSSNSASRQQPAASATTSPASHSNATQSASPNSRPTNSKHQNQSNSTMTTPATLTTGGVTALSIRVNSNCASADAIQMAASSSSLIHQTMSPATTSPASRGQQPMGQLPSRPQSAMAGSLAIVGGGVGGSNLGQSLELQQQQHQLSSQQLAVSAASSSNNLITTPTRVKTTRVRINSTSEQIQDPNWLIRMSKEMEQARYKKSHLKNLHRKLKSTITSATTSITGGGNSSSSSGAAGSSEASAGASNGGNGSGSGTHLSGPESYSSPVTPVKVPVSILKQPSTQSSSVGQQRSRSPNVQQQASVSTSTPTTTTSTTRQQQQQSATKGARNAASGKRDNSNNTKQPPVQISIQNPSSQPTPAQPASAQSTLDNRESATQSAASASSGPRPSSRSSNHQQQQQQQQGRSPTPQKSTNESTATMSSQPQTSIESKSRPIPICADGQVKVSGWKRNNLLAKTLGHLDEIRGNQRPIFMPTKITLPVDRDKPIGSPASGGHSRESNKFAELVREAIIKKSLLTATSTGANTSISPQQQQQHQTASKRTSDGEVKAPVHHQTNTSNPIDHHEATRSASAGGSHQQSGQHRLSGDLHQGQPMRSSSAMGGHSSSGSAGKTNRSTNSSIKLASHHHPSPSSGSSPIRNSLVSTSMFIQQASNKIDLTDMTGGPASARQLKLQLKNNQLLQNLRRQSNETQRLANEMASSNAGGDSGAASSAQTSGGAHLKDWKRLTNKLGLLTGRNFRSSTRSALLSAVESSNRKNSSTGSPLRLTVSNQECGSTGQARRTSGGGGGGGSGSGQVSPTKTKRGSNSGQQQLTVPGAEVRCGHADTIVRHRGSDGGITQQKNQTQQQQERKLSSSSMVVQPVSGPPLAINQAQHRSATGSPMASNSFASANSSTAATTTTNNNNLTLLSGGQAKVQSGARRSSDSSDAPRSSDQISARGTNNTGLSESTVFASDASAKDLSSSRPVVVNRDDLIQLLQVTSQQSSASQSSSRRDSVGSAASRASKQTPERRSLQLEESEMIALQMNKMDQENLRRSLRRARSNSLKSLDQIDQLKRIAQSVGGQNGDKNSKSVMSITNFQNDDREQSALGNSGEPSAAKAKTRHDFLWVVSRTSRVAFFHKKLRKIGWHHKQAAAGANQAQSRSQSESQIGEQKISELESLASADVSAKLETQSKENAKCQEEGGDQVALDPNLIGDAIEIFLRTAMQSSPSPSVSGVGVPSEPQASGHRSSLDEKDEIEQTDELRDVSGDTNLSKSRLESGDQFEAPMI